MEKQEIVARLQENSSQMRSLGVQRLGIFGSYVRGEQTDASDVDLLVEFSQPVGLFQFIGLQQRLESLLGCKVDLGTLRSLKSRIKDHVLQEAIRVA